MSDIWHGFRLVVVVVGLGIIAWAVSQFIPQIQSAATLPARVQAENALIESQALAAPTFVALSALATRSAIENEQLAAQANANATTVQAQAQAAATRQTADTWSVLASGALWVIGTLIVGVLGLVGARMVLAQRSHTAAIREAREHGGMLLLPNNHTIQFQEPKQLASGVRDSIDGARVKQGERVEK